MILAGAPLASVGLGSVLQDPGAIVDPTILSPITTTLNGFNVQDQVMARSLHITDTLGQPTTATIQFKAGVIVPSEGMAIRIRYYQETIFDGRINRVQKSSPDLQFYSYQCECIDGSAVLVRRKLRRNFTDLPIPSILASVLANELAGEPITVGTIESVLSIPFVDAKNVTAYDLCRSLAQATGQTFFVDFDDRIQMRSITAPSAPRLLDESAVELAATIEVSDQENYRNDQTVIVTGTPPGETDEDANMVLVHRTNEDQIAARQAIEGGSGRYEAIDELTHPTSNDAMQLQGLGITLAEVLLATSGTIRRTLRCRVRGYGFRAGQVATVTLPTFGAVGTYVIERVNIQEEGREYLYHDLDLSLTSLRDRAYDAWAKVIRQGQIIVQLAGFELPVSVVETFTTPGAANWTVPAGVTTVTLTCTGASGSGSGAGLSWGLHPAFGCSSGPSNGARGGSGGKAIASVNVTPGEELNLLVGTGGTPGGSAGDLGHASCFTGPAAGNGVSATVTTVSRGGIVLCQADGGTAATSNPTLLNGSPGGGSGGIVTVGGGKTGGAEGEYWGDRNGAAGQNAEIQIEYHVTP